MPTEGVDRIEPVRSPLLGAGVRQRAFAGAGHRLAAKLRLARSACPSAGTFRPAAATIAFDRPSDQRRIPLAHLCGWGATVHLRTASTRRKFRGRLVVLHRT